MEGPRKRAFFFASDVVGAAHALTALNEMSHAADADVPLFATIRAGTAAPAAGQ